MHLSALNGKICKIKYRIWNHETNVYPTWLFLYWFHKIYKQYKIQALFIIFLKSVSSTSNSIHSSFLLHSKTDYGRTETFCLNRFCLKYGIVKTKHCIT